MPEMMPTDVPTNGPPIKPATPIVSTRVFAKDAKASVSCMDLVFSKGNAKVTEGALFYAAGSQAFVAPYLPIPATK